MVEDIIVTRVLVDRSLVTRQLVSRTVTTTPEQPNGFADGSLWIDEYLWEE